MGGREHTKSRVTTTIARQIIYKEHRHSTVLLGQDRPAHRHAHPK